MKEQIVEKNKQLENAEEQLRRAQANLAEAKRKQNADKRKAENHQKYIMGGLCVKYLDDAYLYEEHELDQIISSAIHSRECQNAVSKIRNQSAGNVRTQQTVVEQSNDESEGVCGGGCK